MNIINTAKAFGCHNLVLLDGDPTPRHLDYLDLLKVSDRHTKIGAVVEFQSRPLLYIISGKQIQNFDREERIDLQCLLANRGERAFLGVLNPGELIVYPINLNRSVLTNNHGRSIKQESLEAPLFFQSVVNGVFDLEGQPETPDYVFKTILDLMTKSSKDLIENYRLNPLDVLSFLGRALFFRFLWDRGIVRRGELSSVCPEAESPGNCFHNVKNSIATCQWLDQTFNGDLLPLSGSYSDVFNQADKKTGGKLFFHLRAILEGWEHAGVDAFQLVIDWGDLNFAHIPIGVLSQVYENFSKIWDSQQRELTSVYYTPKNIARYLVDDAFEGIAEKKDAQILDPSCGAGIFLVLAFRKLVAARWEYDGKRPDTKTIQAILYNQVCGFDVSESALRLAALSLYITAIELNRTPRPPKSLKFPKPLQDVVLYNHRRPEEKGIKEFVLGSLRPDISNEFNNRFDMIIGNPPWSRLKGDNTEFTRLTRRILEERGLDDISKTYNNPDNNPDLPFLWKSVQWAKPGGIIAMALPGRIFLKQTDPGTKAFNAILRGVEITGILNGSNLSDSNAVWPGMNQPFMLFFARNRIPSAKHPFYFVTPHFEKSLNDKGRLRIDYQSAQPVSSSDVIRNSQLLKTLALGTVLDTEIIGKLKDLNWPTVLSYWKNNGLYSGLGYNVSPKLQQKNASFMCDLPVFTKPPNGVFSVDVSLLYKFKRQTVQRPRQLELYTAPLLVVPQSQGAFVNSAKSYLLREDVVFSQSYYGFSAYGISDISPVICLHLVTHSELFRYYVLMTCSRIGAERRTMTKYDLENFPFPEIDKLPRRQRERMAELSNELETSLNKPWQAINEFIFDLYGLDEYDRQIVNDTLAVSQPFKESRDRANASPSRDERREFYAELKHFLTPSFSITNEIVTIDEVEIKSQDISSCWHFFVMSSSSSRLHQIQTTQKIMIPQVAEEANKTGCSRVIVHGDGNLFIGILSQYRYWTLSRARICALDIQRHHLDIFPIGRT